MKSIIILVALSVSAFSTDILTFRNGKSIQVKVKEVTDNCVIYVKSNNLNGPQYTNVKDSVLSVTYENGEVDNFTVNVKSNAKSVQTTSNTTQAKEKVVSKNTDSKSEKLPANMILREGHRYKVNGDYYGTKRAVTIHGLDGDDILQHRLRGSSHFFGAGLGLTAYIYTLPIGLPMMITAKQRRDSLIVAYNNEIAREHNLQEQPELNITVWSGAYDFVTAISDGSVLIGGGGRVGANLDNLYIGGNFEYCVQPESDSDTVVVVGKINNLSDSIRIYSARNIVGGGIDVMFKPHYKDVFYFGIGGTAGFWNSLKVSTRGIRFKASSSDYYDITLDTTNYDYVEDNYFGGGVGTVSIGKKHFFLNADYRILFGTGKPIYMISTGLEIRY